MSGLVLCKQQLTTLQCNLVVRLLPHYCSLQNSCITISLVHHCVPLHSRRAETSSFCTVLLHALQHWLSMCQGIHHCWSVHLEQLHGLCLHWSCFQAIAKNISVRMVLSQWVHYGGPLMMCYTNRYNTDNDMFEHCRRSEKNETLRVLRILQHRRLATQIGRHSGWCHYLWCFVKHPEFDKQWQRIHRTVSRQLKWLTIFRDANFQKHIKKAWISV